MGIAERKEREKQEMKEMVLSAAMKLFLNDGFEKVTIRKIAAAIEYSPAAVYLYFKDKNDILCELQKEGFRKFFQKQLPMLTISDPYQRLGKLGDAYIEFGFENPEYYELMFNLLAPATAKNFPTVQEERHEGMRTFEALYTTVDDCLKQGKLSGSDAMTMSVAIWGLVHGLVSLSIKNRLGFIQPEESKQFLKKAMSSLIKENS